MPESKFSDDDRRFMARALELASRGEGQVEPNPMVGCVLVRRDQIVGEGWHQQFGGPHAEVEAIAAAGAAAAGATAYVTLEPCAHTGKTPPCSAALIAAGVARVVVAMRDPDSRVDGRGLARLEAAGVRCEEGLLEDAAAQVLAPFIKLRSERRPWVIAKWAMTLDGKIAAASGDSRWISGESSRARVHALRGRMDAIVVGRGTAAKDDPLLTARPSGPRTPMRIVLDSTATLSVDSRLVRTALEAPVLVAASADASSERCSALRSLGVDVWQSAAESREARWFELLDELGRREMTNVLVEGGAEVFGMLLDSGSIDEVHAFIAPRLTGGAGPSPIAGRGAGAMDQSAPLHRCQVELLGEDVYMRGRLR
jgi:diaminohydroxyphosphoribosylaminopyrimidine deaminase/5-amino-6-(5-phosphoribosylamino)uracil reductase